MIRKLNLLKYLAAPLALLVVYSSAHAVSAAKLKSLRLQAEQFEQQGSWEKACIIYEKILQDRANSTEVRDRYRHCLRRFLQVRRHKDESYRKEVLTLSYSKSLQLYQMIMSYLADHAIDRDQVNAERMFRMGLAEFTQALLNPEFQRIHLPNLPVDDISSYRNLLLGKWESHSPRNIKEARASVRQLAVDAVRALKMNPTAVVMEFVCGGCHAIDDYTMYLTPNELQNLCRSLKGENVGVGLSFCLDGDRLVVKEVIGNSPADDEGIYPGDRILAIAGKSTSMMSLEMAAELLYGEPDSEVLVEVESSMLGMRQILLRRTPILLPSVSPPDIKGDIGYLAIRGFQDTTVDELDTALAHFLKSDVKALVLDLRGNCGGVLKAAVESARRFLPSGVIVTVQNPNSKNNVTFQSRNNDAIALPLVVLVDGDTASAAEVLAGALKENHRARLVGKTSFGKGCIQEVLSLAPAAGKGFPGGLRMTVSRFLSPNGFPYSGRGVEPHVFADRFLNPDSIDPTDHQLSVAFAEAQRMLQRYPN